MGGRPRGLWRGCRGVGRSVDSRHEKSGVDGAGHVGVGGQGGSSGDQRHCPRCTTHFAEANSRRGSGKRHPGDLLACGGVEVRVLGHPAAPVLLEHVPASRGSPRAHPACWRCAGGRRRDCEVRSRRSCGTAGSLKRFRSFAVAPVRRPPSTLRDGVRQPPSSRSGGSWTSPGTVRRGRPRHRLARWTGTSFPIGRSAREGAPSRPALGPVLRTSHLDRAKRLIGRTAERGDPLLVAHVERSQPGREQGPGDRSRGRERRRSGSPCGRRAQAVRRAVGSLSRSSLS